MAIDIRNGAEVGRRLRDAFGRVIVGLERAIETVMIGLLTPGDIHHVSFEGDPGVGKTILAEVAARVVDGAYQRAQGNADLVPATFTGYWKYLDDVGGRKILKPGILVLRPWQVLRERFRDDPETLLTCNDFARLPGMDEIVKSFPVVVLYDEANRTNPWANGAFLEAMQEYKVTVDGVPIPMNPACLYILTRNKLERGQTFAYPEAMQSRLALEDELLPPYESEALDILKRDTDLIYQKRALSLVKPVLTVDELLQVRDYIAFNVKLTPAMDHYIMQLVSGCLNQSYLRDELGVERVPLPKGGALETKAEQFMRTNYPGRTAAGRILLTMKQIAKTVAYLQGATLVRPSHLKNVFHRAIMHHIFVEVSAEKRQLGVKGSTIARAIADTVLKTVDEPRSKG